MPLNRIILFILLLSMSSCYLLAQTDTSHIQMGNNNILHHTKDSLNGAFPDSSVAPTKKKHLPRIATIRSAIIPGWGQAYNKEYWKIPIVWGAIGIPVYTFFYNNSYYKKTSFAYSARYNQIYGDTSTSSKAQAVDAAVAQIDPQLLGLDLYSLETYRDEFRKDRDYSILWFGILWGINVVDATVFAHLKDFDVSRDLSLHIRPNFNITNGNPNISFAINTTKPRHKPSVLFKQ